MERGEWEDDPEYPRAPLPAHERTWRHPSEQGATQWVQSEPPLVVGRGLSVATGTVGAVLAVGLLWLMIPHDNKQGGGVSVQGSTTVRVSASEPFTARQTTTLLATPPAELSSAPVTSIAHVTTTEPMAETTTTPPPPPPPASSVVSTTPAMTAVDTTPPVRPPIETVTESALAVALVPGHFVAATAAAVGDRSTVTVQLPSGVTVVGTVVSVASGIAVISVPSDVDTGPIVPSQIAIPTDAGLVMAPDPTPVSVWRDDTGTQVTYDPSIALPEGSLVLDSDHHLIGMCTGSADGVHLIEAAALLGAINGAIAGESPVWLGTRHILVDDAGNLTVTEVDVDSPAAAAGIQVGSLILAIDGIGLAGLDGRAALWSNVMGHHPGDTITLSILAPGATDPTDVVVTLVPNPGSF